MGGTNALHLPWTEHNFRSDPEAAQIVLASGAPMAIVPLDVTTQVRMRTVGVARPERGMHRGTPGWMLRPTAKARTPRARQRAEEVR